MTRCRHDLLPLVSEACADDAAILALSVTRSVAAGYMTGDVACWDAAYAGAETVLGEEDGPAFVAAMTAVVRALRAEREADWSFLPATCCRVTPHEEELLGLLQSTRGLVGGDPVAMAARLANQAAPRLAAAAVRAARILDRAQSRLGSREGLPRSERARQGGALH